MDRCEIPRCRAEADLTFLGKGVCTKHFDSYAGEDAPPGRLREVLGLPMADDPVMEEAMDDGRKTKPEGETDAPTKATKAAKAKKQTVAKQAKPAKPEKPKRERIPEDQLCVFAFRASRDLRDELHRASGPAGASRFAVSAITAAMRGDRALFDELATQAKANQK